MNLDSVEVLQKFMLSSCRKDPTSDEVLPRQRGTEGGLTYPHAAMDDAFQCLPAIGAMRLTHPAPKGTVPLHTPYIAVRPRGSGPALRRHGSILRNAA